MTEDDDESAEGWEGIMLTYTEQDWPGAPRYERTIPGWKCRRCSRCFGTSGPPPSSHECVGAVALTPTERARAELELAHRCEVCGWPLKQTIDEGCVSGNCSLRPPPRPAYLEQLVDGAERARRARLEARLLEAVAAWSAEDVGRELLPAERRLWGAWLAMPEDVRLRARQGVPVAARLERTITVTSTSAVAALEVKGTLDV